MEGVLIRSECLRCGLCCQETEMILLISDVRRLSSMGYRVSEFAVFDGRYYRLRNVDGHCYFYEPVRGVCKVYKYRPLGCRIYPIIWVEGLGPVVDSECPLASELSTDELKLGIRMINEFLRKLRTEYSTFRVKTP